MQCAATFDRGRRTNDQKEGKSVSVRKRYSGCLRDWKGTDSGIGWLGLPNLRIDAQLHCRMDIKQFLGCWHAAHSFAHHCGFPADVTVG